MKYLFIYLFVGLSILSCGKKADPKAQYYKSQPRDAKLIGEWKLVSAVKTDGSYSSEQEYLNIKHYQILEFTDDCIYKVKLFNGNEIDGSFLKYWYNTSSTLINIYFQSQSWMYGSYEDKIYYRLNATADTFHYTDQKGVSQLIFKKM